MPRRSRPPKRSIKPDVRHGSVAVSQLINRVMQEGRKSTASRIVYDALDIVAERTKKAPVEVVDDALNNIGPVLEVKPRRVGGSTYQIPVEVAPNRRTSLALRWLLAAARSRPGKTMAEKLAGELVEAAGGAGAAVKKREDTHRMAEANKAFAHYRW